MLCLLSSVPGRVPIASVHEEDSRGRPLLLQELLRWLEERHSEPGQRLRASLNQCLEGGPWRQHCQRLLQLLPQQDLLSFAEGLLDSSDLPRGGFGGGRDGAAAPAQPGAWLVFRSASWRSLEKLVLAAALGCSLPLLLRLLQDEDREEERREVATLVERLLGAELQPEQRRPAVAAHWRLRQRLRQRHDGGAQQELRMMLLLHLFAAAFTVQQQNGGSRREAEQLQGALAASGMECVLAPPGADASGGDSHDGKRSGKKRRHKRQKSGSRKKRRRRHGSSSSSGGSSGSEGYSSRATRDLFAELGAEGAAVPGSASLDPSLRWRWRPAGGCWQEGSGLELLDFVTQ